MARMKDVDVDFISLVSKGANKQKIQIYKADEEPETQDDKNIKEATGFFNAMKSFFTKEEVEKADEATIKTFSTRMATSDVMSNLWKVNDTLVSVMRDILNSSDAKDKEALLNTAIDEHGAYLKTKVKGIGTVAKSEEFFQIKKEEGGVEDMKREELQEIIKEAIAPISEKVEAIEKELNPEAPETPEAKEEGITKEEIAAAVKEALSPLSERIEKVENHKGVSKQLEEQEDVKKESTSIFAGINI